MVIGEGGGRGSASSGLTSAVRLAKAEEGVPLHSKLDQAHDEPSVSGMYASHLLPKGVSTSHAYRIGPHLDEKQGNRKLPHPVSPGREKVASVQASQVVLLQRWGFFASVCPCKALPDGDGEV